MEHRLARPCDDPSRRPLLGMVLHSCRRARTGLRSGRGWLAFGSGGGWEVREGEREGMRVVGWVGGDVGEDEEGENGV